MHKVIEEKVRELQEQINIFKQKEKPLEIIDSVFKKLSLKPHYIGFCLDDPRVRIVPNTIKEIKTILIEFAKYRYFIQMTWEVGEKKCFVWTLQNKNDKSRIDLVAYFYKEGQFCQYKKVGEETTPVYELVCE